MEILLAVSVFFVAVVSVFHLYLSSYRATVHGLEKTQAVGLAREGVEAARSIKNGDTDYFKLMVEEGFEGDVEVAGGVWGFIEEVEENENKFVRVITIEESGEEEVYDVVVSVSWTLTGTDSEIVVKNEEVFTLWQQPYAIGYRLEVMAGSGGSINSPEEEESYHEEEQAVVISAQADEGYAFDSWSGDVESIESISSATTEVVMNGDYVITANFVSTEE